MRALTISFGVVLLLALSTVAWGRQPLESATTRPAVTATGRVLTVPSVNRDSFYGYYMRPGTDGRPRYYVIVPPTRQYQYRSYRSPYYYHGGRYYQYYSRPYTYRPYTHRYYSYQPYAYRRFYYGTPQYHYGYRR